MAKFPWVKLGKKTDPELPVEPPIWMGNHSNGEYFHMQTRREARMREEILRRAEREARRHGMDRRAFLASSIYPPPPRLIAWPSVRFAGKPTAVI